VSNTCPRCHGEPCLSAWRKLTLGPNGSARCSICGCKVGLDYKRATLVLLPIVLLTLSVAAHWFKNAIAAAMLLLVLLPMCAMLYVYWVPLTPREATNS
jgi:hypothetical protein